MREALREKVTIQPGGRIEVESRTLPEGLQAEIIVLLDDTVPRPVLMSAMIGAGKGCYNSPEDVDAFIRCERDAWES